jgi:hypothetical protein
MMKEFVIENRGKSVNAEMPIPREVADLKVSGPCNAYQMNLKREYNSGTRSRHPERVKMYAELARITKCKKSGIKSLGGNIKVDPFYIRLSLSCKSRVFLERGPLVAVVPSKEKHFSGAFPKANQPAGQGLKNLVDGSFWIIKQQIPCCIDSIDSLRR